MKARLVLRESNDTLKEGYGFINQRDDCLKFTKIRGLEVVKEHQLIESSSTWSREDFDEIIEEAIQERGEIPIIVFPRVDRFARNIAAAGYYLGLLRRNGLTVMFAQENLVVDNESSEMNVLMFSIHSFKAAQDGKQIKHNMLRGRDRLATEAHEIPNGMAIWPFDYLAKRLYGKINTTGKPTLNRERAAWIMKWADWILEEGIGVNEVCRRMNEASVPSPRASRGWKGTSGKWSPKAIRDICKSRQLMGEFWWKGELYEKDESLRILTNEIFEALQKTLDENRERSYYNATKYDYPPLLKMVFCGYHTNQIMYRYPAGNTTWYYCPLCRKENRKNQIKCDVIWEQYQKEIKNGLFREERLIPAIREQFDGKETISRLEEEIKSKFDEIKEWDKAKDAAFRMGMRIKNYSQERVQEQIDKDEENIQRLRTEITNLEKKLRTIKERKLNEEGIKRLCQLVAHNIDNLTKGQWQMLNQLLKLRVMVYNKELIIVNVALPPVRDTQIEFSSL